MTNAALGGDNLIWSIGDWLTPLLWETLGKSQRTVFHMPMLWMSQLFFSHQRGMSCFSAPKEIGLLVWDIGKDIFKEKNFAHSLVILFMPG